MPVQAVFNIVLALAAGGWVVTLIGAVLSVMAFDAPSAQGRWQAWAFVVGMCGLSLTALIAIIAAKWFFGADRPIPAFVFLALPAGLGAIFLGKKILS